MSQPAMQRAEKQARTSIRELVCPDELPWPTLEELDYRIDPRPDGLEVLLDHWRPGHWWGRVATTRDDLERHQRASIADLDDLSPHQYVSMSGPRYRAVIAIESDNPATYDALRRFPVPPAYVALRTTRRNRGRWHAIWLLEAPVSMDRPKSAAYLRRVTTALKRALGDTGFTGGLHRSPFYVGADVEYAWQHLHSHKVTLTDLAIGLADFGAPVPTRGSNSGRYPVEMLPGFRPESSPSARGGQRVAELWERDDSGRKILRNVSLFHAAQRWAFPIARSGVTVQESSLRMHLLELNRELEEDLDGTGRGSLDGAEVEGIARSVAGFCARTRITGPTGGHGSRWTPEQRRRGGLARSKQKSAQGARIKGGIRSGETRRGRVVLRRLSVQDHLERGLSVSQIAEREGVSVWTVRRDVRAIRKTMGPDPTDLPTSCSPSEKQAQEPEETSDPISSETTRDDEDVRENALDPVRVSEEPVWISQKPPDDDLSRSDE